MKYTEQLQKILSASGWSQEELARELGVSFPAVNAWMNERAVPRKKAVANIERLFHRIVGTEQVDEEELESAKVVANKSRYSAKKLLNDKNALDTLTLYLTYHTNTIEGSTMTLSDVEDVIFDNKVLANRTSIEQAEARNHQAALHWVLDEISESGDNFSINEDFILNLHTRLMNGIISDAGKYRNHSVRIMGAHVSLANWQKIPELMAEYTVSLQNSNEEIVAALASTHAQFEKIHPFSDGNGRTGRLLLLAQALSSGFMPPLVLKERKNAYYKYLELAQTSDNTMPLELFIAQAMNKCAELLGD